MAVSLNVDSFVEILVAAGPGNVDKAGRKQVRPAATKCHNAFERGNLSEKRTALNYYLQSLEDTAQLVDAAKALVLEELKALDSAAN